MKGKLMSGIWQDLRYAVRMLVKNPGFAVLAVLMMAIGIGINTTAYSVINLLFSPLPAEEPERMVNIYGKRQGEYRSISYAEYRDISRQSSSFSGIIATSSHGASLEINGETEMVSSESVSDNYFSVLGIRMEMGRGFAASNRQSSNEVPPVVISHGLWQTRFGSDPAIIGKTITIYKRTAIVRGVALPSFPGLKRPMLTDIWLPFESWESPEDLARRDIKAADRLIGRLHSGAKIEQARAELDVIARRLAIAYPATDQGISYTATSVEIQWIDYLTIIAVFLSGPILVLIICCMNISGMMLARMEERQSEIAMRLALGSGRRRLLQQLLTESFLLALLGTLLGLTFTYWLIKSIPALIPNLPMDLRIDLRLDLRVLLFALGASIAASLVSGLAPALQGIKRAVLPSMKGKTGIAEGRRFTLGLRSILVAGQVAISVILLIATGLFVKSLLFTERINPGFDTRKNLLIVNYAPFMNPQESSQKLFHPVLDQMKAMPGVKNATYAFRMLMGGMGDGRKCEVSIPGVEPPKGERSFVIRLNFVGRDYFQTVGTQILRGRAFDRGDELPDQRTVIISEAMAKRFWPEADPIGSQLIADGKDYRIVGIAQNNMEYVHKSPEPFLYIPFTQVPSGEAVIIVETIDDPLALASAVKDKIRSIDKMGVMLKPGTLRDVLDSAFIQERMLALATTILGTLGIILAAGGLYAVIAYLAHRRTHEIGVRIALGAQRRSISALMIGRGFKLSLIGIAAGLIASFFIMQLLAEAIYGVAPTDIWTFLGSALLALLISLLASYIPARQAAKVDPAIALRSE